MTKHFRSTDRWIRILDGTNVRHRFEAYEGVVEDIRRQVISASCTGLSPDTLARTETKGAARKTVPKVGEFAQKRGSG